MRLVYVQKEAIEYINNIKQEYDIVAITCLGTEEDQKNKRTNNLVNHYGEVFSDVICIPVRHSKEEYLKKLSKGFFENYSKKPRMLLTY